MEIAALPLGGADAASALECDEVDLLRRSARDRWVAWARRGETIVGVKVAPLRRLAYPALDPRITHYNPGVC